MIDKNNVYHLLGTALKTKDKNDMAVDMNWPDMVTLNQPMQAGNYAAEVVELPAGSSCNFLDLCSDGKCGVYSCGDYEIAVTKDELNNQYLFTVMDKENLVENPTMDEVNEETFAYLTKDPTKPHTILGDKETCVDMNEEINNDISVDDVLFSIANEKGISINELSADGDVVAIVQDYFPGMTQDDIVSALDDIKNIVADANSIIVGNTDSESAGATPIEKPEVPTTGNIESTSFQMGVPSKTKDKNAYPEDVSEEGINLVTDSEAGEGVEVSNTESVEEGEGIIAPSEGDEPGEGIVLATDGEAGEGINLAADKNNISTEGTSGENPENPFEDICEQIDNSGDKVAVYKAIIDKLADDPDISIEDKVALVTLS